MNTNALTSAIKNALGMAFSFARKPTTTADGLPYMHYKPDPSREFVAIAAPDQGLGYVDMPCPVCGNDAHLDTDCGGGGCFSCGASWFATDQPTGDSWPLYLDCDGDPSQ
ncbi:MAG: hypothetical protein HQL47_05410 [Gammaproteobacteria bacterium]|nr:hypothetical protein [Gammaproteobacteria bacterium]